MSENAENTEIQRSLLSLDTSKLNLMRRQLTSREPSITTVGSVWQALSFLASTGWKRAFRSYRVVTVHGRQDPAFRTAADGDLEALQSLISFGQATLHDNAPRGPSRLGACRLNSLSISRVGLMGSCSWSFSPLTPMLSAGWCE